MWDRAADFIQRLGSPLWEIAREALADLDEYLLIHKRSFLCLADRVAGRPDAWPKPVTAETIESVYRPK